MHRNFADAGIVDFAIGFGTTLDKVEAFAAGVKQHTAGDAVVWFAYPKSSSKRYTCEFNRDTGWESLGRAGLRAGSSGLSTRTGRLSVSVVSSSSRR